MTNEVAMPGRLTVGQLRKAIERLTDDDPIRVYVDLYCLETHVSIARRANEERTVDGFVNSGLFINVGVEFKTADFTNQERTDDERN